MSKKIKTIVMAGVLTTAMTSLAKADDYSMMQGYSNPVFYNGVAANTAPVYNFHYNAISAVQTNHTSENVANIQQALANLGYNIGRFGVTGHINNSTEQAVKEFQADNHIKVDGVVGWSTAQALNSGNFAPTNNSYAMNYAKNMATIQAELQELGYNNGHGTNGVYDNATADSIRTFQLQNNLATTGVADASTVNVMNSQILSKRNYGVAYQQPWRNSMTASNY